MPLFEQFDANHHGLCGKNLASAVFVSGRDAKTVEDLDLNFSFIRFNKNKVDYENKTVTSRFLWGKATAAYREGYGVTLLRGVQANELEQQVYPFPDEDMPQRPLPKGDSATKARLEPIAKAFVDDRAYTDIPLLLWYSIKVEWWQSTMIRALHPI